MDLIPTVHIEEPFEPRPIEGASTNIAAFIGSVSGDPEGELIHSARDFAAKWPGASAVGDAVEQFFVNGGSTAWIAPVTRLTQKSVRKAIGTLHPDVSLVAVIAEPAAPRDIIAAATSALEGRRAMLLVEGPWFDAAAAVEAMAIGSEAAIGAQGADVAVYWPRLRRANASGAIESISPLGGVAGVIARTDDRRGVFTAPAGPDAALQGVTEPATAVTRPQAEALNGFGVNVIRSFPGMGTVVWGARTQSADAEWRYVPARRTAQFIEESIERGLSWAVFEPNDEPLWRSVRERTDVFLSALYRQGAFAGDRPEHAYFVKCDATTMTQNDLDNGRLVFIVGVAPLKPAEFVVLTISVRTARRTA